MTQTVFDMIDPGLPTDGFFSNGTGEPPKVIRTYGRVMIGLGAAHNCATDGNVTGVFTSGWD